jgi:formylglycine-generating enzyme required for sulfatase activity
MVATAQSCARSDDGPLIALEVEAKQNTLDGCTTCGCRVKGRLLAGSEYQWWTSFGLVKPDLKGSWEAAGASSHCGRGSFEELAPGFSETLGTPYVILDLSTTATALHEGELQLETQLAIQKLSGFDEDGQPIYARSLQQTGFGLPGRLEQVVPLLVADAREKDAFGVHEVLLRLRATVVEREGPAAYGLVSVTADVPGAELLLDGGFVGRISEGKPVLLKNVLTGSREIRVRDLSDREARREVVVSEGNTAEVTLEVLGLPAEPRNDVVPIGENPQGYQEYWRDRDGAMLVRIPAGEFLMGSPEDEGEPDERPQHRVYVSEFLIDKTEVSWRQLRKFAGATGSSLPPEPIYGSPDDYPASFVLWEEAKAFCEWAGGRLPTEAEWEKAARGTDGRKYAWGDEWDARRCNSITGGMHQPESVGAFRGCMSPYGVVDMAGSMWEWCSDRYGENYYAESESRDPTGPTAGNRHVMRGGAWMSQRLWLRAAYRAKRSPTSRNLDHGFRCAYSAPE